MSVEISLTPHNLFMAGLVGISRHVKGAWKPGRYGVNNSNAGWQVNCDGAAGEMAVAKWLDVFYDGNLGNFKARDAGPLEVRTTALESGCLIIHPEDRDDGVFVLVLSHKSPTFILRGWLRGAEAKAKKYWKEGQKGRPAFFVPQNAPELKEMETLPRR